MTNEITNEELQELKAIAEAASPGPWSGDRYDGSVKYEVLDSNGDTVIRGDNSNMSEGGYGIENEADEKYILAFHPAAILALIAKVESLAADAEPIELKGVQGQIDESSGFWRSCSGCLETEDGHPVGRYPYSNVFKCQLGNGCSECGGIGAVWDNTDYESMYKSMTTEKA